MGCCVSSHEKGATQSQKQSSEQFLCISKSPPRPEEESVKEVLSETPNPKPRTKPTPDLDPTPELKIPKNVVPETEYQEVEVVVEDEGPTKPKIPITPKKTRPGTQVGSPDPTPVAPACAMPEEISDSSEMCSMSESVSTNTLRDRDREEDELHVQQQWSQNNGQRGRGGYRSQGQNGHFAQTNRAFSAGRSPLKRVDPSPPRRRNPAQVSARREPGENSGRRSGSPGRRANAGRSPSGRRAGPSPGRVRMVRDPNESESDERKEEEERERESEWQGPNESLENPLVSLECFIFL